MTVSDEKPTTGTAAMCVHRGTKAISARAIPASEPSSPARGTHCRIFPPSGASSDLNTPMITSTRAATCQPKTIAWAWSSP